MGAEKKNKKNPVCVSVFSGEGDSCVWCRGVFQPDSSKKCVYVSEK